MDNKMFCFQCEQTAGCTGCTGRAGVCGKPADVAALQDELTGALIGLARAVQGSGKGDAGVWKLMIDGLFTTVTNVSFNAETIKSLTLRVKTAAESLAGRQTPMTLPRCGRQTRIYAA